MQAGRAALPCRSPSVGTDLLLVFATHKVKKDKHSSYLDNPCVYDMSSSCILFILGVLSSCILFIPVAMEQWAWLYLKKHTCDGYLKGVESFIVVAKADMTKRHCSCDALSLQGLEE